MNREHEADPFIDLTMAAEIDDPNEVTSIRVEKLQATEAGRERLASYDGPLPDMSIGGSVADAFLSWFGKPNWKDSDHAFGYLAPDAGHIVDATGIQPSAELLDQELVIRL